MRVTAAVRLETVQQAVDVFQVSAHCSLGYTQAAGDLGVGVPGGDQVQQFLLPGGEPRGRVAAAFGVEVGLVQVRAQHGEQVAVAFGEIGAGPRRKISRRVRPGPAVHLGSAGRHTMIEWSTSGKQSQYMPELCHCLAE